MKIEQLQQLLKIVEMGSMNEAARALYTARSSLSTSMKNLEQELGVYCVIDEAYADFLPVEESAANLRPEFKCMISVRTFSKGWGLAGAGDLPIRKTDYRLQKIGKTARTVKNSRSARHDRYDRYDRYDRHGKTDKHRKYSKYCQHGPGQLFRGHFFRRVGIG